MRGIRVVGLLAAVAAIAVAVGDQPRPSLSSTEHRGAPGRASGAIPGRAAVGQPRGALGEADGAVPAGTTVFDDAVPGVARLDPALLRALRQAATRAADDGVELLVDSGWRSRTYQAHLLDEAVVKYGSRAEAARWVASPNRSAHVSGDAVDVGPSAAAAWLSAHGAAFGLCRVYGNEPWHYELRPEAIAHGCPSTYADPTQDPRMRP
jgi:hypothetical protein